MGGIGVKFSGICWRFGNYFACKGWRIGFGLLGYFRRVYGPGLRHGIALHCIWVVFAFSTETCLCVQRYIVEGYLGLCRYEEHSWLILAP